MHATLGALAAVFLASSFAGAHAQGTESAPAQSAANQSPDGWTKDAGGGFAHVSSETKCPLESDGFKTLLFSGAAEPNIVGICHYADAMDTGDAGIRLRRYLAGVGESPEAIANDRMLIEPGSNGPPLFTVRIAPLTVNGKSGARLTITKVRGGLLVDCYAEDVDFNNATAKVAALCSPK